MSLAHHLLFPSESQTLHSLLHQDVENFGPWVVRLVASLLADSDENLRVRGLEVIRESLDDALCLQEFLDSKPNLGLQVHIRVWGYGKGRWVLQFLRR